MNCMLATKLKENFIIENYLRVVGEAAEKEHSYKQLTHQILQKQAEYDELVKQSDYHKSIKQKYDDTNIDPYDRFGEVITYIEPSVGTHHVRSLTVDYVKFYQKFSLSIEAYLCEILNQITYKLYKIKKNGEVEFPKEVELLVKAFTTQYEK